MLENSDSKLTEHCDHFCTILNFDSFFLGFIFLFLYKLIAMQDSLSFIYFISEGGIGQKFVLFSYVERKLSIILVSYFGFYFFIRILIVIHDLIHSS